MDSKKAKYVIAKVREKKGMSSIADMQTQLQKQLRGEAMRDILNTALLGAGAAGTVRGGQGLWNLLTRSRSELRNRPGVAPLPVPYRPSFQDEEEDKEAMEKFALRGSGLKYLSMKHGPQGVSLTRPISGLWGGPGNKLSEREREIFDVLQERLAETTSRKGTTGDAVSAVAEHLSGLSDRGHFSTHGYPDVLEMEKDVSRHLGIPGYHKDDPIRKEEEKEAFVTPAMLIGGGIGAGYGAGSAPKGEVVQNMVHHGARGLGTGTGASLGSLLGAGGGVGVANLVAKLMGTEASPKSQGIGALTGLLAGGIGGGVLGNKATKALFGKSPGERESKEDEKIEVLMQRAQQARQEGEDNNGFSFRKYSADKQAVSPQMLEKTLSSGQKLFTSGKIPWKRLLAFARKVSERDSSLVGKSLLTKNPPASLKAQRRLSAGPGVSLRPNTGLMARLPELEGAGFVHKPGGGKKGFKYAVDKQAIDMPKPGPTSKPGLWWYMPSMLGAGALGGYGGWKLIDHILDKRRRKEIDDEVDESRNEFQEALVSQYKEGSDSKLGVALDELYAKMNKEAFDINSIVSPDTRGRALGAYATYAIPSSILGYLLVKGLTDKGSRGKILAKAQQRRALKQQQARPAELYAVPVPIDEEEE